MQEDWSGVPLQGRHPPGHQIAGSEAGEAVGSACGLGVIYKSLGWEDPLKKGMATHSSILAWKISWTEEPGRLQSMGLQSQTRLND